MIVLIPDSQLRFMSLADMREMLPEMTVRTYERELTEEDKRQIEKAAKTLGFQ